tara:strand:- start:924 stop:2738 length:1815 start_codon:yes stop_codon:yes gene_type:complete
MSKTNEYNHTYINQDLNQNGENFTYTLQNNNSNSIYDDFDYLHKIFVKLELPSIYSSNQRQFKWIKNLGYNIIENVELNIQFKNSYKTKTIKTLKTITLYTYTEWLYIWNEINLSDEEKNIHNELIGNISELYDPANAGGRNNSYPVSHLNRETYRWSINDDNIKQATINTVANDYNYNKPPSIPGRTLYIPLNFYFCNSIDDMIPLGTIDKIFISIKTREVRDLYILLLQPEDFIIDSSIINSNVTNTTYNQNVRLPNGINFTSNTIPNFNSSAHITTTISNKNDLSMFDVLINRYEIKPFSTGNTAIHNFLTSESIIPINIQTTQNSIAQFYNNICKISITFNIIKYKQFNKSQIKIRGLFKSINKFNLLNVNTENDGSKKQHNETINIVANKINELFFVLRHSKRDDKNDLLNFTNLDHYNTLPWELNKSSNIVSYNSNIELLSNSLWEHLGTSSSIKIGIGPIGDFFIKKHVLDNNVFKYIDILNYKAEEVYEDVSSIYNTRSNKFYNEAILEKCKIKIEYGGNSMYEITSNSENYNFYNKVLMYKKYKKTIPGLYYINNSFSSLKKISFSECDFNKIKINDSEEYESIIFCIEEDIISY